LSAFSNQGMPGLWHKMQVAVSKVQLTPMTGKTRAAQWQRLKGPSGTPSPR
jgi:hypothetical protein